MATPTGIVCRGSFPFEWLELRMQIIGIDPHKGSHTAVAIRADETVIKTVRGFGYKMENR